MNTIEAKTILSPWSDGSSWFGMNYNMNLYKGCSHGCIYCDSRSECYQIENFDQVRVKENVLALLEKELCNKRKKGNISFGAMNDPYNPFEKKYEITRGALQLILKYGFGVGMLTKSDLVVRDLDLYEKINETNPVMVKLTITTFDDQLCQIIEPHVSHTSQRMEAIRKLSDHGIYTGVMLWPLLPYINDTEENVKCIIEAAAINGAHFIAPYLGVTLRMNQRLYFYQKLDKYFPGIKDLYIKEFGSSYECISPNAKRLYQVVEDECQKLGLLYKMDDIRNEFIKRSKRQISLFDL